MSRKRSAFEQTSIKTKNTMLLFKESRGFVPRIATEALDEVPVDWIVDLTDTLKIWLKKGATMTGGELILARVNLGSLVEFWLKFFYCIYIKDYDNSPFVTRKGKAIPFDQMTFDQARIFAEGILWSTNDKTMHAWVRKTQKYRNAIHAFKKREIGTSQEFIEDLSVYYEFVEIIYSRLPPIEDYIDHFPAGFISSVDYDFSGI